MAPGMVDIARGWLSRRSRVVITRTTALAIPVATLILVATPSAAILPPPPSTSSAPTTPPAPTALAPTTTPRPRGRRCRRDHHPAETDDDHTAPGDERSADEQRAATPAAPTATGARPAPARGGRRAPARAALPARRRRRLLHGHEGRGPRRPLRRRTRHQRRARRAAGRATRSTNSPIRRTARSSRRPTTSAPSNTRRIRGSPAPIRSATPCTRGTRWPTRRSPTSP